MLLKRVYVSVRAAKVQDSIYENRGRIDGPNAAHFLRADDHVVVEIACVREFIVRRSIRFCVSNSILTIAVGLKLPNRFFAGTDR